MRIPKLLYTELALVNISALGTICSLHESLLQQLFYQAVNGSLDSIHHVFSYIHKVLLNKIGFFLTLQVLHSISPFREKAEFSEKWTLEYLQ